jgi:hypothetical protein
MTIEKAIEVLTEMNKWRKLEPPYEDEASEMPFASKTFGDAIDVAIAELKRNAKQKEK